MSLREKPDPDTVTFAPTSAEEGLNEIDAPLTTKVAEAESPPGVIVALIVYVPGATELTLNDADKVPFEIVHLEVPTGVPDSRQPVSVLEKYEPVTSTDVPICAEEGVNVSDGEGTVKLADAESPASVPVAVTEYELAPTLATVNAPVKVPLETEQVEDDTTLPVIEQVESVDEKPEPETSTIEPAGPEYGLRAIDGLVRVGEVV